MVLLMFHLPFSHLSKSMKKKPTSINYESDDDELEDEDPPFDSMLDSKYVSKLDPKFNPNLDLKAAAILEKHDHFQVHKYPPEKSEKGRTNSFSQNSSLGAYQIDSPPYTWVVALFEFCAFIPAAYVMVVGRIMLDSVRDEDWDFGLGSTGVSLVLREGAFFRTGPQWEASDLFFPSSFFQRVSVIGPSEAKLIAIALLTSGSVSWICFCCDVFCSCVLVSDSSYTLYDEILSLSDGLLRSLSGDWSSLLRLGRLVSFSRLEMWFKIEQSDASRLLSNFAS